MAVVIMTLNIYGRRWKVRWRLQYSGHIEPPVISSVAGQELPALLPTMLCDSSIIKILFSPQVGCVEPDHHVDQ